MKRYLTILSLLPSLILFGQDSTGKDLEFIAGKIRTAYAGYSEKKDSFDLNRLVSEIRKTPGADTFANYSRLTDYFRDDHLKVFQVVRLGHEDSVKAAANRQNIGTWVKERSRVKEQSRVKEPSMDKDGPEGYWLDDLSNCVLYLHRISSDDWRGYLVETKDRAPSGLEVLRMTKDTGGQWKADYKDMNGEYRVMTTARFRTPGVLIGRSYFKFKKCDRYYPGILAGKTPFSYRPSITVLDSQTVLLRMPYFEGSLARRYDSLVKANSAVLSGAKMLIIDIRGNPGGTVRCFLPLLPFVCTGPIREVDGYQLCSQALIDDQRNSLQEYEKAKDSARASRTRSYIDTLLAHKGSFMAVAGREFPCEAVPNRIQHVAVLMDHGSRSAAELLILYFRQSKKVRLFGENSGGAVDYLDQLVYWLPNTGFQFWAASTRRVVTPGAPLYDSQGIPPDIRINDEVPDWVEWVRKYYDGR